MFANTASRFPILAGILFRPGETFDRLRAAPSWLTAFVFLSLGTICADWLNSRIGLRVIETASDGVTSAENADRLMEYLGTVNVVVLGLSPLGVLVKWLATAAVLYWLMVLVKDDVRFKAVLSVAAHCWVVTLLEKYFNVLILHLKGVDRIIEELDFDVVLGLDILLGDSGNVILGAVLKNITVFSVWYVCLMILGLSKVIGVTKRQAAFAVIFLWVLVTGWKAMLAALQAQMPTLGG